MKQAHTNLWKLTTHVYIHIIAKLYVWVIMILPLEFLVFKEIMT